MVPVLLPFWRLDRWYWPQGGSEKEGRAADTLQPPGSDGLWLRLHRRRPPQEEGGGLLHKPSPIFG